MTEQVPSKPETVSAETTSLNEKMDVIIKHVRSLDRFNSITVRNLFKSFLLGLAGALGATLGLAIIIGILGFVIKIFGGSTFVGAQLSTISTHLRQP